MGMEYYIISRKSRYIHVGKLCHNGFQGLPYEVEEGSEDWQFTQAHQTDAAICKFLSDEAKDGYRTFEIIPDFHQYRGFQGCKDMTRCYARPDLYPTTKEIAP